jgi:hypothetical protein
MNSETRASAKGEAKVNKLIRVCHKGQCIEMAGAGEGRERSGGPVVAERTSMSPRALLSRCITVVEEWGNGV